MSRRVALRRNELGLSIDDVAHKTGVSPAYLRYFEEHSDARMSAGSTNLLAMVLKTTPAALRGRVEWQPGGDVRDPTQNYARSLASSAQHI